MAHSPDSDLSDSWEEKWHKQSFIDHAGRAAIRLRLSEVDLPIPENLRLQPLFPLQLYTTIPIQTSPSASESSAEDGEQSTAKRPRGENDADVSMTKDLEELLFALGGALEDSQRPAPVWELYESQSDVFACVEHQRREIAYRASRLDRDEDDALPIPLVAKNMYNTEGRAGLCIVIDSYFFRRDRIFSRSDESDPEGPQWAWFDRPSTLQARDKGPIGTLMDRRPARYEAEDRALGSRVELEVVRKQRVIEMSTELANLLFWSCAQAGVQDAVADLDLGSGTKQIPSASRETDDNHIATLAAALSLSDFSVTQNDNRILITSTPAASTPDLQYSIAVFDAPPASSASSSTTSSPSLHRLEQHAKAFTHLVAPHLGNGALAFTFYTPPSPSFASALETAPDLVVGRMKDGQRRHPISRQSPVAKQNDPATSDIEPYRKFLVVLDGEAVGQPRVRFVVADGGRWKARDDLGPRDDLPGDDFVEAAVWRYSDMAKVAQQLAMVENRGDGEGAERATEAEGYSEVAAPARVVEESAQ